ncbi:MAG: glycosyltransferase family 4 protein [Planctomycetia bacterium]|nr:glycosyltransferase family 4 protein [Planctomycetia bacterium]
MDDTEAPPPRPECAGRRLRIAFVVHEYNRHHGHSRYVAELATRFKRQHDVHIFAASFEEPNPENLTFHHVPKWRANAVTNDLSFFIGAAWKVPDSFDIVHAQGFCSPRQNVVTAHMCNAAWFDAIDRFHVPQSWRKRIYRAISTTAEKLVYRPQAARRFIAVSHRVRRDLENFHGLRDQIRVVYHGTDIERFHPRNREAWRATIRQELQIGEREIVALYVGDWQKVGPAVVGALAKVPDVRCIVVTRTPSNIILSDARAAGIEGRITLVPPTPEIHRYYGAADFFLFPTFYDTFGLVLTEAMASGLPAIASREAGASELIVDRENGWLIQNAWDHEEIALGIRALATDEMLRNRMGSAARTSMEHRTWDCVAAETLPIYYEVVAETKSANR